MTDLQTELLRLQTAREERKADVAGDYHDLVVRTTDGSETDPARAAEILDASGKSPEDLERDCVLLEERRRWADRIAQTGDAEARYAAAEQQICDLTGQRNRAISDFNARIERVAYERAQALDIVTGRSRAESELRRTAWPHLLEREAEIKRELARLGAVRQEFDIELHRLRKQLAATEQMRDNRNESDNPFYVSKEQRAHYVESCKLQAAEIKRREQRLADMARESDELLSHLADIEKQKLIP